MTDEELMKDIEARAKRLGINGPVLATSDGVNVANDLANKEPEAG